MTPGIPIKVPVSYLGFSTPDFASALFVPNHFTPPFSEACRFIKQGSHFLCQKLSSAATQMGHRVADEIKEIVNTNIAPLTESALTLGAAYYINRKIPLMSLWLAKLLPLAKDGEDEFAKRVQPVARTALMVVTTSVVLQWWGIDMAKFVLGLGIFSTALGLALRDQVSNVLGGMLIKSGDRFKLGDFVQIGTRHGKVVEIGITATTLRGVDDSGNIVTIKINNASILSQDVIVKSIQQDFVASIQIGDRFVCGETHGKITGKNEYCFFYSSKDAGTGEESTGILRFEDLCESNFRRIPWIE